MFKVSQDIYLNASDSANHSKVFGKYQKAPDADQYQLSDGSVFVSPELTDVDKIQILHFPEEAVHVNELVDFVIKRNGVRGNFEAKLETPSGTMTRIPLLVLDPERIGVRFSPMSDGLYKIHMFCNTVKLPGSPFFIVAVNKEETINSAPKMPNFQSDPSKIIHHGTGLQCIMLNAKNEFIVDASNAGNNILLVGICGPKGQCDEVSIKHLGRNVYNVTYRVQDPGHYVIAAKWGEDHIPGSPFTLATL